jgi:hypothetical protein
MKQLLKAIDDRFLDQTIRRARLNGRRLANPPGAGGLASAARAWRRERTVPDEHFLSPPAHPRFIGGTTGRSGTRWLVRVLKAQFRSQPVVIDEIGVFVLSLLREAPYEYYQFGTDDAADRRGPYVEYFLRQMERYAFRRRNMYGGGMRGLVDYVPRRAIRRAGDSLKRDLRSLSDLPEITRRFGDFYLHLLNYHAAIVHGGSSGWINKEPPYGRHADELLRMVPGGRLVVLARDGRASALSMFKRRWMSSVRECMERWGEFARMTVDAVERAPTDQVLLLRYEDLVRDFEPELARIHHFFELPEPEFDVILSNADETLRPQPAGLDRWAGEIADEDLRWFEVTYGDLMERLGYRA